jgi:ribosomal protein S6--L-glutamate ligase
MKIAILGVVNSWENKELKKAAQNLGHELDFIRMKNVMIKIDPNENDIKAYAYTPDGRKDFADYNAILRRWVKKYYVQSLLLCWYLKKKNKVIVNSRIERIHDKVTQMLKLRMARLPHPRTLQVLRPKIAIKMLKKAKYPVILKRIEGSLGKQVYKANSLTAALKLLKENEMQNVIIQEYLPAGEDYRVFVVGRKVLGAMKRIAPEGDFRSNVARGSSTLRAVLTKELKELALKAARVMGYEIAGVDILYYKDKPYILEVNRTPQFRGFTKTMGISVAEEMMKYLEQKYRAQRNLKK